MCVFVFVFVFLFVFVYVFVFVFAFVFVFVFEFVFPSTKQQASVIYFVAHICLAVTPTCAAQSLWKYGKGGKIGTMDGRDHSQV